MKMKNSIRIECREEWKAWLEANHATATEVWLVAFKKHTGRPGLEYEDAVQEALCYGWIDSLVQRIDDSTYARKFTPRRPGSKWSKLNRDRASKLLKEKRMTKAGLATLAVPPANVRSLNPGESRFNGTRWFTEKLRAHRKAFFNFTNLAPSYRRLYIRWVTSAKKEETRLRRLKEAIALLHHNRKLGLK